MAYYKLGLSNFGKQYNSVKELPKPGDELYLFDPWNRINPSPDCKVITREINNGKSRLVVSCDGILKDNTLLYTRDKCFTIGKILDVRV